MVGLPFAGKSVVVDILSEHLDVQVVRPSDWCSDSGSEEEIRQERIAAWQIALEKIEQLIPNLSATIILDCGNSKFSTISDLIYQAKRRGHVVALVYVNARGSKCQQHAGAKWVPADVYEMYVNRLKESLPKYKKACNRMVVVNNHGTLVELRSAVTSIVSLLA